MLKQYLHALLNDVHCVKKLCSIVAAVVIVSVVGYGLLFASASIPTAPLKQNLITAAEKGEFDANYPRYVKLRKIDLYTECVGLGIAAGLSADIRSLMEMKTYGECEGLKQAVQTHFAQKGTAYYRYIHGYQIVLKPLYTLLGIESVRVVVFLLTLALLATLCLVATLRLGLFAGIGFGLSFLFIGMPHVFFLTTHAPSFWLVVVGALTMLVTKNEQPFFIFALIGATDAYVSFLNMGSLSLSLPLLSLALVQYYANKNSCLIVKNMFFCSVAWAASFLLVWLVKWGAVSLLFAQDTVILGATLDIYPAKSIAMIGTALFNNFKYTVWQLWVAVYLYCGWRLYKKALPLEKGLSVLLFPALIPFIWVCLLPGQSGVKHALFVCVIMWTPLAAALLFLIAHPRENKEHTHVS